jgi:hypothetical protein
MKSYKRIFQESDSSLEVDSSDEAKQIVDISGLEWGETFKSDWKSAQSKCPQGWRLPTVQELYTAYIQNVEGFESDVYWSSSTYSLYTNLAHFVNFKSGDVSYNFKTESYYVCCVREINTSYENKIESLLIKHLKKNYNKSPKEIEAIEFFISRILDDLESTEFTMVEASKLLVICKRFLGTV